MVMLSAYVVTWMPGVTFLINGMQVPPTPTFGLGGAHENGLP